MGALFGFDCQIIMKLLILLSFLAFSAYADPVENGMYQWFNYLKSQPVLLQEERRQAEDLDRSGQQNFTYFVRADGTREDCNCDANGSLDATCDAETGQCPCKSDLITGEKCDHSTPGYFNFPDPEPCACNAKDPMVKLVMTAVENVLATPTSLVTNVPNVLLNILTFPLVKLVSVMMKDL